MSTFATPDFGTGAAIAAFGFFAWLATLVIGCFGVWCGNRLRKTHSAGARKIGVALMVAFGSIPVTAYVLPQFYIKAKFGNFPVDLDKSYLLKEGMTKAEVQAILGTPHERGEDPWGDRWYYWRDSLGANWWCVDFDDNGRFAATHFN
jgi:hypothetical protein